MNSKGTATQTPGSDRTDASSVSGVGGVGLSSINLMTAENKISGDMLLFSSGLMVFASMLWLAIYWGFGQRFSTLIPLIFQAMSACMMFFYLKTKKLQLFCLRSIIELYVFYRFNFILAI